MPKLFIQSRQNNNFTTFGRYILRVLVVDRAWHKGYRGFELKHTPTGQWLLSLVSLRELLC